MGGADHLGPFSCFLAHVVGHLLGRALKLRRPRDKGQSDVGCAEAPCTRVNALMATIAGSVTGRNGISRSLVAGGLYHKISISTSIPSLNDTPMSVWED